MSPPSFHSSLEDRHRELDKAIMMFTWYYSNSGKRECIRIREFRYYRVPPFMHTAYTRSITYFVAKTRSRKMKRLHQCMVLHIIEADRWISVKYSSIHHAQTKQLCQPTSRGAFSKQSRTQESRQRCPLALRRILQIV
jgi:hypothetical protein